jgi:hypothetical protein
MKKFLALYRMDMEAMKKFMTESSEEDRKKGMMEWATWMKAHAADFSDPGAPTGKNTQVTASGAKEMSNDVAGYSIIQAESKEAAVALLADSPHMKMPGATMDVMEVVNMGM